MIDITNFTKIAQKFEEEKVEYLNKVMKVNDYFDKKKEQFYARMHQEKVNESNELTCQKWVSQNSS